MDFLIDLVKLLSPAAHVLTALILTVAFIGLVLLFIVWRRWTRGRYLCRRDQRKAELREQLPAILRRGVVPRDWLRDAMSREILEELLAERLETSSPQESERLVGMLRQAGVLTARIREVRGHRGWRRQRAMLALGKLRAPECVPILAELLGSRDVETRHTALVALGRTRLAPAGTAILERMVREQQFSRSVAEAPLLNALLLCCWESPQILVPYLDAADRRVRARLARLTAELGWQGSEEHLLRLAEDRVPAIRAAAAAALARYGTQRSVEMLLRLSKDPEWSVRRRAVLALGRRRDAELIPLLVAELCDANRSVRLSAAQALGVLRDHLPEVLERVVATGDRFARQTLVAELERTGSLCKLAELLAQPEYRPTVEKALRDSLDAGLFWILVDLLANHEEPAVRRAVGQFLVKERKPGWVTYLKQRGDTKQSRREQRIGNWLAKQLQLHPALRRFAIS